jgi:hypothetical protein
MDAAQPSCNRPTVNPGLISECDSRVTDAAGVRQNGIVFGRRERIMSAAEVIVAALAAGAGAGLHDTASTAVHDAYIRLRELLKLRIGNRHAEIVEALDDDETEPEVAQAGIGAVLIETGTANDQDVLAAAWRVLSLADPETARTFKITIQNNHGAAGTFHAPVTFNQGSLNPPARPELP